jgi:hypothetical protein
MITEKALAILRGHQTYILEQMLDQKEGFIPYAINQHWPTKEIADTERVVSAIKSELARRGAFS